MVHTKRGWDLVLGLSEEIVLEIGWERCRVGVNWNCIPVNRVILHFEFRHNMKPNTYLDILQHRHYRQNRRFARAIIVKFQ